MTVTKVRRNATVSKARILDTAEKLFSNHGYDGVSMRIVSTKGRISLGLLTYHFATKDILFEAVISRRAETLNAARKRTFEALPRDYSLEQVIDAFTRPILELMTSSDRGWRAYGRLVALMAQDYRWTELTMSYFGGITEETLKRIMIAEPRLGRAIAIRAFTHLISVLMGTFAINGLLDRLSQGKMTSEDLASAYPVMLTFIVSGIRGLR
jgi:AcrR family transcriptional regulator